MRLSTAFTLALTALLVTSTLGAVAASPSTPAPTVDDRTAVHASTATTVQHSDSFGAADPKQVFTINITESGDAEWTVESRFILEDDDETERFMEFATDRVSNDDYPITAFDQARANAEQAVDREMSIEDDQWNEPRTEAPTEDEHDTIEADDDLDVEDAKIGVISYSFTWTNFGKVDGDRIYVDDVFQNDDGSLFSFLNSNQQLVIQVPPNYEGATPGEDDGVYTWTGPTELDNEPDLVFLSSVGTNGGGFDVGWIGGGLLLFALVFGIGGYLLAQRRSDLEKLSERVPWVSLPGTADGDAGAEGNSFGTNRSVPPAGETPVSDGRRDAELEFDEVEDVDPSLLSDEERVHRMLSDNGGRMKQATIVKETGWSNAKVSQLLSKMDDDEEIEKLRIGRENLITHPEVDPTEID
ncbi:helix-turn-helix transcriptional regulator [Halostagnicola bangensis]